MKTLSVSEVAKKWGLSERSIRNYCSKGRIEGAFLEGKTWKIPEQAKKPMRMNSKVRKTNPLLEVLRDEKRSGRTGGIYHKIQIELTYNSNHIEGSRLTHDQTRYIYETNTIGFDSDGANVDDIIETTNHFRCIDLIIDKAQLAISEKLIKELHFILKTGTSDSRKDWFEVGNYKRFPNEVGGLETTLPEEVSKSIKTLLREYNQTKLKTFDELLDFHYKFERIHPFQDGNGRVGRLLLFKECLRNQITPFIIEDDLKMFYYRGLNEWKSEKGYLRDTCLTAQDRFKVYLDYFRIPYDGMNDV
ncbi:Oligopeptide ABC transporter, periplasmic oligopeptide-binding protein OppA [Lachnospiraceae bacterium TWA4]|nr:Oligopeptide ABC transporter, periplasmic oligopeptide-binding protein OppA [Lachnospiraceae bacterium TWA4]